MGETANGKTLSPALRGLRRGLAIAALLAVIGFGVLSMTNRGQLPSGSSGTALVGGPFSLVTHEGVLVTEAAFAGRPLLLYFGYTFCPDVCPTELQAMTAALQLLEDDGVDTAAVQPLFITIDPARDTVAVMARYVPLFHPRLIGLTGTEAEVKAANRAWRVYSAKVEDEGASEYLMDHSSIIFLMRRDGSYFAHFGTGTPPRMIADRLRELIG